MFGLQSATLGEADEIILGVVSDRLYGRLHHFAVDITTTSGAKHQFRVSSVHDGSIYGDHDSVPFSEIASVERREYSGTKTTILVAVILGVVGAVAIAVNSGEHPNTGL
jgi:hypothetical protein